MSYAELIKTPTVPKWLKEIRELLAGTHDSHIRSLGTAEEYVERILRDAKDRRKALDAFNDALSAHLVSWQPDREYEPYELARTCELIAAFTPMLGFSKLMSLLETWQRSGEMTPEDPQALDARFRVLTVLECYYDGPTLNAADDSALRRYLDFLSTILREPAFTTYAIDRLLALDIKVYVAKIVDDDEILALATRAAVNAYLTRGSTAKLQKILLACLLAGHTKPTLEFIQNLEQNGPVHIGDLTLDVTIGDESVTLIVPRDAPWAVMFRAANLGLYSAKRELLDVFGMTEADE